MSITISGDISSEDDVSFSLGHTSKGFHQDLTKYLVYHLTEEEVEGKINEGDTRNWKVDLTLPYPYSQSSGDITLNVKDDHSGDVTSTRLVIRQEGNDGTPFFDPAPKSTKALIGQDVFVNTQTKGSSPLRVSILIKYIHLSIVRNFE